MWYLSQNPVEVDVVTSIVEKFEETHPGVTVEISVYGFEDMLKTLKLALDSGSGPDVAYSDPSIPNGVAYAKAGHLLDLTDAIEKYGWDERFAIATNQGWWWDHWTPGHIYGLPYDMTTVGVYFNKAMFDELGLEPPKTFEEFQTLLATVKEKKPDVAVMAAGVGEGWPAAHLFDQVSHSTVPYEELKKILFYSPDGNWNQPGFIEVGTILQDWFEKGYFEDNLLATGDEDALNMFLQSKAAMYVGGAWHNGQLKDAPFEVHFLAMPPVHTDINPDGSWHYGGYTVNNSWMVNQNSQHQEQALELVDHMLGKDAAIALWEGMGDLVAYNFAEGETPAPVFPFQKEIYDMMHTAQTGFYVDIPSYYNEQWAAYQSLFADKTPEEVMQELQELYQRAVSESQ
jgi:raffinose/stachyose/melibiose transport system substrate-binding protein